MTTAGRWGLAALLLAGVGCAGIRPRPAAEPSARHRASIAEVERLVYEGRFERAHFLAAQAVRAAQEDLGGAHPVLAAALLAQSLVAMVSGDVAGATAAVERARAIGREAWPQDHPQRIRASLYAADSAFAGGEAAAASRIDRALQSARRQLGPQHPLVAECLADRAHVQLHSGRFEPAAESARRAIAIWQAGGGGNGRLRSAWTRLTLARAAFRLGRLEQAEEQLLRALRTLDTDAPPGHPIQQMALTLLSNLHWQTQRYAAAVEPAARWARAAEARWGAWDPRTAEAQVALGKLLGFVGRPAEALAAYERALPVLLAWRGAAHPSTAGARFRRANALLAAGRTDAAVSAYEKALASYRAIEGEVGKNAGLCRAALGRAEFERGNYARAEELLRRALAGLEAELGRQHREILLLRANLGQLLYATGRLREARRVYREVVDGQRAVFGPRHPHTLNSRILLGRVLARMGDVEAARRRIDSGLEQMRAVLGDDSPLLAHALMAAGEVALLQGDAAAAWEAYSAALGALERGPGLTHPTATTIMHDAAHALTMSGHYAETAEMYAAVERRMLRQLGSDHPAVAQVRATWALLMTFARRPDAALAACQAGVAGLEKVFGRDHYRVGQALRCLALARWQRGELPRARAAVARMLRIAARSIDPLLAATSERERLALIGSRRLFLNLYLSLFDAPDDGAAAYAQQLRWKGVVVNSLAAQRSRLLAAAEPELAGRFAALAEVRNALAGLVFAPAGEAGGEGTAERIRQLTARKEALERELAAASSDFAARSERIAARPVDLCAALGPDEAMVDFLRYDRYRPAEPAGPEQTAARPRDEWQPRYLAFVLIGGDCRRPVRVELGAARRIEREVADYRKLVREGAAARRIERRARRLFDRLWRPLQPHLGPRRRIWLVPDGALNGLPFDALVDDRGRYLIERFIIGGLATAQQLLRPEAAAPAGRGALVAGGIDFGPAAADGAPAGARSGGPLPVRPLPGTAREAERVGALLDRRLGGGVEVVGAGRASEARIRRSAPGRRVIHLATHGFFLPAAPGAAAVPRLFAGAPERNPMVRSGLILAGANAARPAGGDRDGLLTAEEVAGLDLRGVELVVLSACETGLGEVRSGEGVMGLQRGFALAGARALVLSLWRVPDADTRRLMEGFYRRALGEDGIDAARALRAAKIDAIRRLRRDRRWADPRAWAGFTISGR
jgi:CHAT domain-containing protein/tetratricopeptide (TPR) repeat protein